MKFCISHMTAFRWYMRHPNPQLGDKRVACDCNFRSPCLAFVDLIRSRLTSDMTRGVLHSEHSNEGLLPPFNQTIDVLVTQRSAYRHVRGVCTHVSELNYPANSFVQIGRIGDIELFIVSPELLFLQLCSLLGFEESVYCGMALCSNYFLDSKGAGGVTLRSKKSTCLTNPVRLRAFISLCGGHRGFRQAGRSLKYVEGNSFSPMESGISLMYRLPCHVGGFGFNDVSLNERINIANCSSAVNQGVRRPDILLKAKGFDGNVRIAAIDYDSSSVHEQVSSLSKDARRRNEFAATQGINYFVLTKRQALEFGSFCYLAEQIRTVMKLKPYGNIRVPRNTPEGRKQLEELNHRRFLLWSKFVCPSNFRRNG